MEFKKHTLKNGVRVVMFPMPGVESVTAEVLVGAGARQEDSKVNGLAHFLEHMVFKGTKKYPSAQIVSSSVDAVGGYINAHTSKEVTAYYIKSRAKNINLSLDLLSQFVKEPLLEAKEIEKEKGVIYEEIAMYEDDPSIKIHEVFEGLLYEGTDLGRPVIGSKKTVKMASRKDFQEFMGRNYVPSRIVVSVAGKFNEREVLALAEESLGSLGLVAPSSRPTILAGRAAGARRDALRSRHPKNRIKVENKKTEQAHMILGVKGNPLGHPDRYKEMVLASILGGGMSSRLFTEVREKRGLAYSIKCYNENFTDTGNIYVRCGLKLTGVEEGIKVILDEVRKVQKVRGVRKVELEKAKEYLKGRYALGLEDTHAVSEFYGEQELLEGKIEMLPEILEGINSVTSGDIADVASKFFAKQSLNLAVIGPYNNPSKFEKLLNV